MSFLGPRAGESLRSRPWRGRVCWRVPGLFLFPMRSSHHSRFPQARPTAHLYPDPRLPSSRVNSGPGQNFFPQQCRAGGCDVNFSKNPTCLSFLLCPGISTLGPWPSCSAFLAWPQPGPWPCSRARHFEPVGWIFFCWLALPALASLGVAGH